MNRFAGLILCALLGGILAACATKPKPSDEAASSTKPTPSPTPAASPAPAPAPTPEVRYTATVKIIGPDGNPVVEPTPAQPTPTPTATPTASPTPRVTPKPTPRPSGNFFAGAWAKIFPPKPTPSPAPSTLGDAQFRVSTDGRPPSTADSSAGPAAPSPTPIMIPNQPTEGFFPRMWHKVFPRKVPPPAAAPPAWIGSIRLVNLPENYVLIDAPNYLSMAAGETLHSVGATTETGVLRVSADRNPPFFIADIIDGRPRAGDRVYSPIPTRAP